MRRAILFILLLSSCGDTGLRTLRAEPELRCPSLTGGAPAACTSVDFGDVPVGATLPKSVFLADVGNRKLTVVSAEWSTDSDPAFTADFTLDAIEANGTRPFLVTFTPTRVGPVAGTFVIHVAGGEKTEVSLAVSGSGVGAPKLTVSPLELAFGHVAPEVMTSQDVTLTNEGNLPVSVTMADLSPTSSAAFSMTGPGSYPTTIAPGGRIALAVRYDTTGRMDTMEDTGELLIASDDPMLPSLSIPITGDCPGCLPPMPDPGCDATFPHRLWPVHADVLSCSRGSTVGANSPVNWTNYAGCGIERDFPTTPGVPIRINTWGDGCGCPGCVLWHINYVLQEDTGAGFTEQAHIAVPDDDQCPGGAGAHDESSYTPLTSVVRMTARQGSRGMGYYYTACSK